MNALQRAAKAAAKRAATVLAPHQAAIIVVVDASANGGVACSATRETFTPETVAITLRAMAHELSPPNAERETTPDLDDPGAEVIPLRFGVPVFRRPT